MNAQILLRSFERRGVYFEITPQMTVKAKGKTTALTESDFITLKKWKPEIIDFLTPRCFYCSNKLTLETSPNLHVLFCSLGCADVRRKLVFKDDAELSELENKICNAANWDELHDYEERVNERIAIFVYENRMSFEDARDLVTLDLLPVWFDEMRLAEKTRKGREAI